MTLSTALRECHSGSFRSSVVDDNVGRDDAIVYIDSTTVCCGGKSVSAFSAGVKGKVVAEYNAAYVSTTYSVKIVVTATTAVVRWLGSLWF